MKYVGVLCIFLGTIWGIYAYQMSTTVYTPPPAPVRDVQNIGLIAEQQKNLICAGILTISGILLLGFGTLNESRTQQQEHQKHIPPSEGIEEKPTSPHK
jgi:hypothetical protein